MEIRENNILFLLGAGCSKHAEIPISPDMVKEVEKLLKEDSDWKNILICTTIYVVVLNTLKEFSETLVTLSILNGFLS